MDQPGPFGQVFIDAQFSCHDAGQLRDFDGMAQDILAITGTIAQAAEDLDEFRMQTVDARFIRRLFASFADFLIDFFAGLFDHFFDACRMDTAIGNQFFQGNAGDFAADRVKARQDDRFRRIVDDEVDAGQRFNSPDIAPFASDDAAFHFIVRQRHDRYRRFGDVVGSTALDSHGNDFPGLAFGFFLGLFFQALDHLCRFVLHFGLDVVQEQFLGIFICQAGNPFQFSHLLFMKGFDSFLHLRNFIFFTLQGIFFLLHGIGFLVQMFFFLQQAPFKALQFIAAFLVFPFCVVAHLVDFFFPFQDEFLLAGFSVLLGRRNDALRFDFSLADLAFGDFLAVKIPGATADETAGDCCSNNR